MSDKPGPLPTDPNTTPPRSSAAACSPASIQTPAAERGTDTTTVVFFPVLSLVFHSLAMRDTGAALLPAVLLAALLLRLASELATLGCGHKMNRADVAAWKRHALVAPPPPTSRATTTTTFQAVAGTGDTAAAAAVLGESKRLVPQGSNPLHN